MGKKNKQKIKARKFFQGFKDFIAKGNIIDLAIAVIIGGAFGKITTSLVNDIIMPPIGLLIGKVDFRDLVWTLKKAITDQTTLEVIKPAVTIRYGMFIMTIIEFLIIAFTIYATLNLVVRRREFLEKVAADEKALKDAEAKALEKDKEEKKEVVVSEEILLLREIRDSLKGKD